MNHSMPGLPVHYQLPEFTQTHVHRVCDAIQPSHPLPSPSPPAPNPSQHQGLFQWSTLCMRWPKYWSFSLSISPSNEHPGLVSFRMDWLDLLAVQGAHKSLLQCQLQQPENQPEGVSGVGGWWCSLWLIVQNYMFISSFRFSFILWQKLRSEVWHFQFPPPRFTVSRNHCCPAEFLLQRFSQNWLYYLLSTFSYVSYT